MAQTPPKTKKLASVKHCMYHPELPTIRHMQRDNICRKLPIDHCRTATSVTKEQFDNFAATNNAIIPNGIWSSKHLWNNKETMKGVYEAHVSSTDYDPEAAIQMSKYSISDGYTYELKKEVLLNPTGRFTSEDGKISFKGYSIRKDRHDTTHCWTNH